MDNQQMPAGGQTGTTQGSHWVRWAGFAVLLIVLVYAVMYFSGNKDVEEGLPMGDSGEFSFDFQPESAVVPAEEAAVTTDTGTAAVAEKLVSVKNFTFSPVNIRVKAGDLVTWVNEESGVPHTIDSDTNLFSSGTLLAGAKFTFRFVKKGNYNYYCKIHPTMKGQVIVE